MVVVAVVVLVLTKVLLVVMAVMVAQVVPQMVLLQAEAEVMVLQMAVTEGRDKEEMQVINHILEILVLVMEMVVEVPEVQIQHVQVVEQME
jgi:hypothetical protein